MILGLAKPQPVCIPRQEITVPHSDGCVTKKAAVVIAFGVKEQKRLKGNHRNGGHRQQPSCLAQIELLKIHALLDFLKVRVAKEAGNQKEKFHQQAKTVGSIIKIDTVLKLQACYLLVMVQHNHTRCQKFAYIQRKMALQPPQPLSQFIDLKGIIWDSANFVNFFILRNQIQHILLVVHVHKAGRHLAYNNAFRYGDGAVYIYHLRPHGHHQAHGGAQG